MQRGGGMCSTECSLVVGEIIKYFNCLLKHGCSNYFEIISDIVINVSVHVLKFSEVPEWVDVVVISVKTFVCIAVLNDSLVRISVKFRAQLPFGGNVDSSSSAGDNNVRNMEVEDCCDGISDVSGAEKRCSLTPLAAMSSARCGLGTTVLSGQLVAIGRLSQCVLW